jgi:hypothetical protein
MQNFINRLCPLIEPILTKRGNRTRARFHKNVRTKTIALVSTCGWWEKGNFTTVQRIVRELARDADVNFAGALLRSHAGLLNKNKDKANEVFAAARQAGFQLIKDGTMSRESLDVVSQPLVSEEAFKKRENDQYLKLASY